MTTVCHAHYQALGIPRERTAHPSLSLNLEMIYSSKPRWDPDSPVPAMGTSERLPVGAVSNTAPLHGGCLAQGPEQEGTWYLPWV